MAIIYMMIKKIEYSIKLSVLRDTKNIIMFTCSKQVREIKKDLKNCRFTNFENTFGKDQLKSFNAVN